MDKLEHIQEYIAYSYFYVTVEALNPHRITDDIEKWTKGLPESGRLAWKTKLDPVKLKLIKQPTIYYDAADEVKKTTGLGSYLEMIIDAMHASIETRKETSVHPLPLKDPVEADVEMEGALSSDTSATLGRKGTIQSMLAAGYMEVSEGPSIIKYIESKVSAKKIQLTIYEREAVLVNVQRLVKRLSITDYHPTGDIRLSCNLQRYRLTQQHIVKKM